MRKSMKVLTLSGAAAVMSLVATATPAHACHDMDNHIIVDGPGPVYVHVCFDDPIQVSDKP
ncbi:MAG: hypothetical protein M3323_06930 [Actinomycetota bacterium]|nr:hypothetical protein [Actinomycetota bacterium]